MGAAEKISKINIYDYYDYREFLSDWIKDKKQLDRKFCLSTFADESGMSISSLSDILNYRRTPSRAVQNKLSSYIKLYGSELSYFKYLIELCDGKNISARSNAFKKISRLFGYRNRNTEDLKAQQYMSSWLNLAIREMAQLPDFQPDPQWIRKRLKFKAKTTEIKDSLGFLFREGFIKIADGKIKPQDKAIHCHRQVQRLALAKIHEEFMGLAQESIYNTKSEDRDLNTYVLGLRPSEFQSVKQILKTALDQIRTLSNAEREISPLEEVYYLSLFAFPLTDLKLRGTK